MNNIRTLLATSVALYSIVGIGLAPNAASAQSKSTLKHRQEKKNEWRNLTIGSGALGILGLLNGNGTLALIGAAGALYSVDRYEKDRKSQSKMEKRRAALYSRTSYTKNGHRYVRKTVHKNGKTYYAFVRVS